MIRRLFYLVCALYMAFGVIYSAVTPIFEASDELWHYPMVHYLANNGLALPVQNPAVQTAWRQEGSQPPFYYLLAALLTAPIDTSDLDYVRRINPHADIGLVLPDGNANMIVHRPNAESFPWRGTVLAVQVARLFSVALGLGTVIVTYCLAYQLFPDRPIVRLGAAALNAFLPMFLFISGSVNNDNASNLLGNLLTLLIVLLLKRERAPTWRDHILIGVVAGMGLLSKLNIGFLVPLVALAYLIVALRRRDARIFIAGGLISGGLTILIAGWWYMRNIQLYGDPTGLNVFLDIVGRRAIPANAAQLWAERESFLRAFWGFFGGVNVPMPDSIYLILNIFGGVGLIGAAIFILKTAVRREWTWKRWQPALITLIWIGVTFVSYLRWTAETPASQGRLIFGALSSICVWFAVGLTEWLPKAARPVVMTGAAVGLGMLAAVVPFTVIAPAYALPPAHPIEPSQAPSGVFAAPDGGSIALMASNIDTPTASPSGYVQIGMSWRTDAPFARAWSLFVHLVTEDGVIVGQRDIYPGMGRLALSDLEAGRSWRDQLAVRLPENVYTPQLLTVEAGWYHLPTGERLLLADGSATVVVGTVQLEPRPNDLGVPNALSINFGGEIELVGYRMTDLSPNAGGSTEIALYWRAVQPLERDYVVFVHIIDPPTLTIHAGSDAQPAAWTRPTSTWAAGEIVEDTHVLNVNPDAPPGIYEVEIGLYVQRADGGFERLRVLTRDGGMANDFAYLNRVRILPREDAP